MTHPRYGRSLLILNEQLTNTRRSDGVPEPDGVIKVVSRKKIIHYRQLYIDRPEPIAFMQIAVDTSGRIYDDFLRLLFLHAHREASALVNDIPEESGHFRFLHVVCLPNIKWSVGLILAKASVMRISIPLDLSSRPFIPPPCFIHSRRPTALLTPSLVFSPLCSTGTWRVFSLRGLSAFLTLHSFGVTLFALGSRLFLIQLQINTHTHTLTCLFSPVFCLSGA